MIKRFHEAPKSIFKDVQKVTDGDYALVNLFDEDPEYYQLFKDAVAAGREVILDNGVFELGKAWDADKFAYWVEELRPTYYIVPDVLEDCDRTVESFFNFTENHKRLPGKIMGVAQGNTYEEVLRCYQTIEPFCDKICFSFDYSFFKELNSVEDKYFNAMHGRQVMMSRLEHSDIINRSKPHHLLGVMLPQEMRYYSSLQRNGKMQWIDSVDTSNPVVHGLLGDEYTFRGLCSKKSQKLFTMINEDVSSEQYKAIMHNINMFKEFCE